MQTLPKYKLEFNNTKLKWSNPDFTELLDEQTKRIENKKILSEHNKHLFNDIEFYFKSRMSLINNRWSLESIREFLTTKKYDEVSYKEVLKKVNLEMKRLKQEDKLKC